MSEQRVGIGYDSHRLEPGRRLVIGGVEVPHDRGPAAHSDGDVLAHAAIDALLGAAALGDIGAHFPDSAERYAGADSLALLSQVAGLLREGGWSLANLDGTVVLERPRLAELRDPMREGMAGALGVEADRVSVKATTNEGMGMVGAGEGVAAICVALIQRASD